MTVRLITGDYREQLRLLQEKCQRYERALTILADQADNNWTKGLAETALQRPALSINGKANDHQYS